MKTSSIFGAVRMSALACLLGLFAGCATLNQGTQLFFAIPALEIDQPRLPGVTEFDHGEAIVLVVAGEGYDGREVRPEVFRTGIVRPVYVGRPVVMTATNPEWWSLGALAPGKYIVQLHVDDRRLSDQLHISVVP